MVTETSSTVNICLSENGDKPSQPEKSPTDNVLSRLAQTVHDSIEEFKIKHKKSIKWFTHILLNIGFITYFGFATQHFINKDYDYVPFCDDDEYGLLILLFCFVYVLVFYYYVYKPYVSTISYKNNLFNFLSIPWVKWGIYLLIVIGILAFLVIDSLDNPNRLIAIVGFVCMLLFGFITSKYPGKIKWSPVISGLIVQFLLGIFTIRWEFGRNIFKCMGDKVSTFLNYTSVGSSFVFGDGLIQNHIFAFEALSVIFYLSFIVKILYYYGIIQKVVLSLGIVLQKAMGTTIVESVNSAANIFLGMTESPLFLQPYLQNLTLSETHSVMVAGFASVSGTVLAAYISFGAKPSHLITASVMSAPAALCYSKLNYPETEVSKSTEDSIELPESEDTSVLDAASKGATQAIELVLGIVANVVAFVAFIAFLNGVINWFGILVGQDNWSIEEGLSYVFMPVSFVMGVPWDECKYVGRLIGIKTVINEFSAYKELGLMVSSNLFSKRTEAIATYAICGFSNPGSVGIMISTMSALMPGKRDSITSLALRSFVAGAVVCFMTACIAGMLMSEEQL